jgi:hypothetical protein
MGEKWVSDSSRTAAQNRTVDQRDRKMDYKALIAQSQNLTAEEKTRAARLVSDGQSEDYYLGMIDALGVAVQVVSDPAERRAIAILAARAAVLAQEAFPDMV